MRLSYTIRQQATTLDTAARIGLAAKGVIYVLSGGLALLAALHAGNTDTQKADTGGVMEFILGLPLGKVLLAALIAGLVCYALWRLVQAIADTEKKGKDWKGRIQRLFYFISGLLYLSLAVYASKLLLYAQAGSGNSQKKMAGLLLNQPFGQALLCCVAAVMAGAGIAQIYRALSGKYKRYVERQHYAHAHAKGILIKTGMAGYLARGTIWLVLAWLFLKAAVKAAPESAGDTGSVFQWLQQRDFGGIILAAIAAGLVCYGLFMFVRARYQPIKT